MPKTPNTTMSTGDNSTGSADIANVLRTTPSRQSEKRMHSEVSPAHLVSGSVEVLLARMDAHARQVREDLAAIVQDTRRGQRCFLLLLRIRNIELLI